MFLFRTKITLYPNMTFASKIHMAVFVFIILYMPLQAQDSFDDQFKLAKQLYDNENYYDAITELKRLLFFEQDGKYLYQAYDLIGQCYKQGGKFTDAIRYFTLAEINAKDPSQVYNEKIQIVRVNILRRTTELAFKQLNSLESDERFEGKLDTIDYWKGWAYMFSDNWKNAALTFAKINPDHPLKKLAEKVNDELYSVGFAKTISYFIPGAGQIYTGEYLSGLMSLGWNVLWGYLTIKAFTADRVFDGIMIGNFLFVRFYRGNLQNAENFAEEKNLKMTNEALNYLQCEYNGLKP